MRIPDVSVVAMSLLWSGAPDGVITARVFSGRKIDHLFQERQMPQRIGFFIRVILLTPF
jgi:hypothetical protein